MSGERPNGSGGLRIPGSLLPWIWSVLLAMFAGVWSGSALLYRTRDEILDKARAERRLELREALDNYVSVERYLEAMGQENEDHYKLLNVLTRLEEQIRAHETGRR